MSEIMPMEDQLSLIHKYRILYVEDEEDLQKIVVRLFKMDDVFTDGQYHLASNGKEGIAVFQSESPDIVVTDVRMPEMDGAQMIRAIWDINPNIPIMVTTAYDKGSVDFERYFKDFSEDEIKNKLNIVTKPMDIDKWEQTLLQLASDMQKNT